MTEDDANAIVHAIRQAGNDIQEGFSDVGHFYLTDEQWEMLPRAICSAAQIARECLPLLSAVEVDYDGAGQAGLVDGLFAISRSLDNVAGAIKSHTVAGRG